MRAIAIGTGLVFIAVGSADIAMRHGLWRPPFLEQAWLVIWRVLHGPWIPLVLCLLICTYALSFGKRGRSQRLRRLAQVPIWPAVLGFWFWVLNIEQLWWPLRSILADLVFPCTVILVLVPMIRVLLSGAREAEQNWVTDP